MFLVQGGTMLGFLIGTVCLFGLMGMAARGHHGRFGHHGYAYAGHGGSCGPRGHWRGKRCGPDGARGEEGDEERGDSWRGGWGGGGWSVERTVGRVLKEKLNLRKDQEDVVASALDDLKRVGKDLKDAVKDSRSEFGDALRGESVDQARLDALFEVHEETLKTARKDAINAIKKAHAVLDADQRSKLADLLTSGPRRWF
jgi:hypothetical protein